MQKKTSMLIALCGLFIFPALSADFAGEYGKARKLMAEKKYAEAEKAFSEAEENAGHNYQIAQAVIGRARALRKMNQTGKAVEMLSLRLKDPDFGPAANRAEACYELGTMLEAQKKTGEAISVYDQGGSSGCTTYYAALCNYRLSGIYSASGKIDEAEKILNRVIDGKFSPSEQIYASCRLARYLMKRDADKALKILRDAEKKAEGKKEIYRVMAARVSLYAAQKNYAAASAECRKIAGKADIAAADKAAALNNAAWYDFKYLKDAAAADQALTEAGKLDPKSVNQSLRRQIDEALKK